MGHEKKYRPPRAERVVTVTGHNPKECPPHGEPTDHRWDQPTYCLDCDRAIRATGNPCWNHRKPRPQTEIEAEQKAGDERRARERSFAELKHGTEQRVPKATPEEKAAIKEMLEAAKALRKARKLRKSRGLSRKGKAC
jgi:hypothetical protein